MRSVSYQVVRELWTDMYRLLNDPYSNTCHIVNREICWTGLRMCDYDTVLNQFPFEVTSFW